MANESSTIVKGKQTVYVRDHDSLEPFQWLGSCSRALGLTEPLGDIAWSECQDAARPGKFVPDVETEGSAGPPEGSLVMKKSIQNLIQTALRKCRWDIDIRYQECPRRDDPLNWLGIDRICDAKFTQTSTDDESAFQQGDDGEVLITAPFKGMPPLVHIWRLTAALKDTDLVAGNINFVAKCQDAQCAGPCGPAEDCFLIAGTDAVGGNPYLLVSDEGGDTSTADPFDGTDNKPNWTRAMSDGACLGSLYIVVSHDEGAYAWATDVDGVWTQVVADEEGNAIAPNVVVIQSPSNIYVVGDDGYIWKSADGGRSISTANGGDAGNATGEDLLDVVAITDKFVVAVGVNNAVVKTENAGATWTAVTGPVAQAGQDISRILGLDKNRWLLGYADGEQWYTDDGGETWGQDESITAFASINGFAECGCGRVIMVGEDTDGDGIVYESVDAGAPGTWFPHDLPAGVYTAPLNDVVCCDPNRYVAVGDTSGYIAGYGVILVLA